jgi:hypothetical protein
MPAEQEAGKIRQKSIQNPAINACRTAQTRNAATTDAAQPAVHVPQVMSVKTSNVNCCAATQCAIPVRIVQTAPATADAEKIFSASRNRAVSPSPAHRLASSAASGITDAEKRLPVLPASRIHSVIMTENANHPAQINVRPA